MHVLVDAADDEDLIVVADGLRAEEFLWLLQGALHALDLAQLRVEREAVRNPAVVAAKDEDFGVVEREATHGVARRPVLLFVSKHHRLPLLLLQVTVAVESFNAAQGLLVLRVPSADDVEVAAIEDADGVEVARLGHLGDLSPLVLGHLVHFALLGRLVGVLGANREEEVLCAVLEALVQVGELVAGATVAHGGLTLGLVSLLVDDEAVVCDHGANLVLLLLASNEENLVVDLD